MSKILFVENFSLTSDNPMSTCYIIKCKSLMNDERFDVYDISKDMIDITKYDTVVLGCRVMHLYKRYRGQERRNIAAKTAILAQIKNKYFLIQDMHIKTYGNINKMCDYLNNKRFNIIFTFYNNMEASIIRHKTPHVKHFFLPLHIDTNIFRDLQLEKKYDILLYGSTHPTHYPFRKRLFELLLTKKDEFNIHYIPLPKDFNPEICEDGLAKLINMSKICIATRSKYDYLLGKYFEIAMGKSLIAGDIPTDGISILKNKIVEIHENMNNEEILNKIRYALAHYNEYNANIESLYTYVKNNHSLDVFGNKLYELIPKQS